VIGKWEKGFDHQRAREVLAGKHEFVIEDDESDEDTDHAASAVKEPAAATH
jgi:hypothetical protein